MHGIVGNLLILNAEILVIDQVAIPRYINGLVEERHTEEIIELRAVCGTHPRWCLRLERPMPKHIVVGSIRPLVRVITSCFAHTWCIQWVWVELKLGSYLIFLSFLIAYLSKAYIYQLLSNSCRVLRLGPVYIAVLKRSIDRLFVYEVVNSVYIIVWVFELKW